MSLSETLQVHAATDVGRVRDHNEDNYLVDKSLGLSVVCDGMGGHAAGEVASTIAVRTVHQEIRRFVEAQHKLTAKGLRRDVTAKEILRVLEAAVQSASTQIHAAAQQDPTKRGMGTTLSLLWVMGSNGYVAHVGDSRIYLERGGTLYQITDDHTVGKELLRLGMATPENLRRLPQNALTRAVGVHAHVQVDTLALELVPADQFLLASDGLTGYLDDPSQLLPQLGDANGDRAVQALIGFANACGGRDNVTALLVRLGRGEEADASRARRVQLKQDVLAQMPLFARLDERELLRVMHVAQVSEFAAGTEVMREGEIGDELYIVLTGKLRISSGQAVLRELGPGAHVGEMALIRNRPRSATVTAVEPSELITIKRYDFFDIIRSEPYIAVKLLWQFLGVVSDWLERTTVDLSKAWEVIRAEDITEEVDPETTMDEQAAKAALELELDPFVQPPARVPFVASAGAGIDLAPTPSPPPAGAGDDADECEAPTKRISLRPPPGGTDGGSQG